MSRRNCSTVIAEMLSKIPKTKDNDDFIGHLKWNLEDASYKAPEQNIQWKRTQQTLIKHIPKPIEDWDKKPVKEGEGLIKHAIIHYKDALKAVEEALKRTPNKQQ